MRIDDAVVELGFGEVDPHTAQLRADVCMPGLADILPATVILTHRWYTGASPSARIKRGPDNIGLDQYSRVGGRGRGAREECACTSSTRGSITLRIHRHVTVSWVGGAAAGHLIVADDEVAAHPLRRALLPWTGRGVRTYILTVEDIR